MPLKVSKDTEGRKHHPGSCRQTATVHSWSILEAWAFEQVHEKTGECEWPPSLNFLYWELKTKKRCISQGTPAQPSEVPLWWHGECGAKTGRGSWALNRPRAAKTSLSRDIYSSPWQPVHPISINLLPQPKFSILSSDCSTTYIQFWRGLSQLQQLQQLNLSKTTPASPGFWTCSGKRTLPFKGASSCTTTLRLCP